MDIGLQTIKISELPEAITLNESDYSFIVQNGTSKKIKGLLLKGNAGDNGKSIEIQKTDTHIQWRQEGGQWINLVALADLKGDKGEQGLQGIKGDKGEQGRDGVNAINPTFTIGTVTTLPSGSDATVTLTGTYPNLVLNIGIPRGADGSGGGSGEGLTSEQLSNIAKIPAIQSTVDALPNNYASKNHNHSEYASSSHRHDASEIDNLPSGGGTGLTTEQAQQLQTAYAHSQSDHVQASDIPSLEGYATETFVTNKIAEASLSGGEVDLSGYATKDDLTSKVDKVEGKNLSTNDLTNELKSNYDEAYLHSQSTHVQSSDIPTKVGQLENDSGFITAIPDEYVTETELEAKGYLTSHQDISGLQTKTDNSLTTTSKEIVGAINELKSNLDGIETGGTNSLSLSISGQTLSLKDGGTSLSSVEIPTATVTDEQVETVITNKINDGSLSLDFEDDLTAYQDLQLKEINIISSSDFVDGYLDINNNLSSYGDFMYTKKYIPVIDGGTYRFGTSGASGNAGLCYYDENKNFISGVKVTTIDNKDVTLPTGTRYIRINISGSKLSDYTINLINSPFRNEISTIKNSVDIIANDPLKNILVPSSNEIIYDLKNDNPKYKGAGGGTFSSITDFFAEKVFVKSIKVNMKASTQEVYLIERDANSGIVNFTIKEKICDLTATTDGELVEYIFKNPLPLKNTEFLAIKNTGNLYLQNTEVQGKYYYIIGSYKLGDTFSYNATNFGGFKFVGEIIYLEPTIGNIDNEFGNIKNNVENNTINIGNLSSKLDNAYDEIKNMRKYPYISVFFDNFNSENSDWINTDSAWAFDYTSRTLTSTNLIGDVSTKSNCIVLNRQYHADKRYASIKIKFSADSILDIGFKNISEYADGNGKVRIDIANSKLEIYNGFNTVVATTNFDSFSIDTNKYYIIELERNRLVASLTIYDYITKESVSVSYKFANGFFFDELYVIGKVSGGNVVIKEFNVNIMLNPLVYIIGDSITAYASAEKGWANMLANDINGNVVISARGNDSAISIPRKFETEVKHIKPNYLLWCHGHNGEGITESRLDEVQSLCDQYGIKLLVNHVTCMAGDAHIAINEIIERKGYRGARFDIATAVDNNPYKVDGYTSDRANSILYRDNNIHPNDLGNMEMYKRLSIDLPELFGR